MNRANQPLHAHQSKTFFLTDKSFSPLSFPWDTQGPRLKAGGGMRFSPLENVFSPLKTCILPSVARVFSLMWKHR